MKRVSILLSALCPLLLLGQTLTGTKAFKGAAVQRVSAVESPVGSNTLTNGLVAVWKLDDDDNRTNSWTSSYTLFESNTVSQTAGLVGNCASFPGNSAATLNAGDADDFSAYNTRSLTISAWFRVANTVGSYTILSKDYGTAGSTQEYLLYVNSGNTLMFQWRTNASGYTEVTDTKISPVGANTWFFACVQFDLTNNLGKLRIGQTNGTLHPWVTNAYNGTGTNTTAPFQLGRYLTYQYPLNGRIDECYVWTRALTDAEITNVFHLGTTNGTLPLL